LPVSVTELPKIRFPASLDPASTKLSPLYHLSDMSIPAESDHNAVPHAQTCSSLFFGSPTNSPTLFDQYTGQQPAFGNQTDVYNDPASSFEFPLAHSFVLDQASQSCDPLRSNLHPLDNHQVSAGFAHSSTHNTTATSGLHTTGKENMSGRRQKCLDLGCRCSGHESDDRFSEGYVAGQKVLLEVLRFSRTKPASSSGNVETVLPRAVLSRSISSLSEYAGMPRKSLPSCSSAERAILLSTASFT